MFQVLSWRPRLCLCLRICHVIIFVFVSRCRFWIAIDMSFQKMYGFGGVGLSGVQLSISELSVVGGGWWVGGGGWTRQTHFMVGPSQGPTKITLYVCVIYRCLQKIGNLHGLFLGSKRKLINRLHFSNKSLSLKLFLSISNSKVQTNAMMTTQTII